MVIVNERLSVIRKELNFKLKALEGKKRESLFFSHFFGLFFLVMEMKNLCKFLIMRFFTKEKNLITKSPLKAIFHSHTERTTKKKKKERRCNLMNSNQKHSRGLLAIKRDGLQLQHLIELATDNGRVEIDLDK
ncbi:hypothetical protein RFI_00215, partial [Reticulomyxa filosa]